MCLPNTKRLAVISTYPGLIRIGPQVTAQIFDCLEIESVFEDVRMVSIDFKKTVDLYLSQLDRLLLSGDFGFQDKGLGLVPLISPRLRSLTFQERTLDSVKPKIRSAIRSLISRCAKSLTSITNIHILDWKDIDTLLECKKLTDLVPTKMTSWEDMPTTWLSKLWCGLELLQECCFPVVEPFLWLIKEYPHLMKRPTRILELGQPLDVVQTKLFDVGNWPGLEVISLGTSVPNDGLCFSSTLERLSSEYRSTLRSLSLSLFGSNFSMETLSSSQFVLDLPYLEYLSLKHLFGGGGGQFLDLMSFKLPSLTSLECSFNVMQVQNLLKASRKIHTLIWTSIPYRGEITFENGEEFVAPSLRKVVLGGITWGQRGALTWLPITVTHLDVSFEHLYQTIFDTLQLDAQILVKLLGKFTSLRYLFLNETSSFSLPTVVLPSLPKIEFPNLRTLSITHCRFVSHLLTSIHAPLLTHFTVSLNPPVGVCPLLVSGLLDCIHRSPQLSMIHLTHVSDFNTEFPPPFFPPLLSLNTLYCRNVTSLTWSVLTNSKAFPSLLMNGTHFSL